MNEKAKKIYGFILIKMNGWTQKEVDGLYEDSIEADEIYQGVKEIIEQVD